MLKVIVEKGYRWSESLDISEYWYAGSREAAAQFASFCLSHPTASPGEIKERLRSLLGNFAIILIVEGRTIAAVDKVRSYPVLYAMGQRGGAISNSAGALREECGLSEIDDLSLLEFKMSGYVSGRETLYKKLYQLQAGEFLIWKEGDQSPKTYRYYVFHSPETKGGSEADLIEELDDITNRVFGRIIQQADGSPIWVPLSGGLDSRLVLCKLRQLGYDNLRAFSYGPPGNYDAKWARYVAERVGVPWIFIPYRRSDIGKFFFSSTRREYWKVSSEFCSLPFMVDEYAIYYLKKNRLIPEDAILVNGQTGDFISGGHLFGHHSQISPQDGREFGIEAVEDAILKKHYSLDRSLMNEENLSRVRGKIRGLLGLDEAVCLNAQEVAKYYEWWEWQERQAKYVVNGQRSYDFFGHRWLLPLWADEFLSFWPQIEYSLKFKQSLYKSHLDHVDLYGLFRKFKPVVWSWQGTSMIALPVGAFLKRFFGRDIVKRFYHYASYFGKYQNHYAPFGFIRWLRNANKFKSPLAFYVETFLKEQGIK